MVSIYLIEITKYSGLKTYFSKNGREVYTNMTNIIDSEFANKHGFESEKLAEAAVRDANEYLNQNGIMAAKIDVIEYKTKNYK